MKQPFAITLKNEFKIYRNILNKLIRNAKIDYFNDKFNQNKGNARKTWEYITELLNVNRLCPDPIER